MMIATVDAWGMAPRIIICMILKYHFLEFSSQNGYVGLHQNMHCHNWKKKSATCHCDVAKRVSKTLRVILFKPYPPSHTKKMEPNTQY